MRCHLPWRRVEKVFDGQGRAFLSLQLFGVDSWLRAADGPRAYGGLKWTVPRQSVFLDFLSQLRKYYLDGQKGTVTFHCVIRRASMR